MAEAQLTTATPRPFAAYRDRRVLMILPLGFASGLPLLLTFFHTIRMARDRRCETRGYRSLCAGRDTLCTH